MTAFTDFSDRFLDDANRLDPCIGAFRGDERHQRDLTDYSPAGIEARAALLRSGLTELAGLPLADHREEVAARFMRETLEAALEVHDLGEPYRELRNLESPAELVHECFDQMPRASDEDWDAIAERATKAAAAIETVRLGLEEGRQRGLVAPRRQVEAVAEQCAIWAGEREPKAWFATLAEDHAAFMVESGAADGERVHSALDRAADRASAAYSALGRWLLDDYLAAADDVDGIGPERYPAHAYWNLGTHLDPQEAYEWAWAELRRIHDDRDHTSADVLPGASFGEAQAHLVSGGGPAAESIDEYQHWLQDRTDETIDWMDGRHIDLPPELRQCEVMLAPAGAALAAYYSPPSNDLRVPGRTWWPTGTRTRFPLWDELTICYHEAVPGHHLQLGWVRVLGDQLPSFQRYTEAGNALIEGWALYAERLMDEFDMFPEPAYRLGFLCSQALRAARVIVDIGLHLHLAIPGDAWFHPGDAWTADLAVEFVEEETGAPHEIVVSEITRYLGWPAQAISYKLGERAWLAGRDAARANRGAAFDLKSFHTAALDLGILGLDQLQHELARL
jgi:uncharacterized protein (DUF885 family)